jgi:hypothetical protein
MFSPDSWKMAGAHSYRYAAFTKARRKTAERIRAGDILFAYISKRMSIAGALVVTTICRYDENVDILGAPGQFPCILQCKPYAILPIEEELKLANHFHRISIFTGLKDGRHWPVCLRSSPKDIRRRDCDYLLALIDKGS